VTLAKIEPRPRQRGRAREMVILFVVGGVTFAIAASAIEEIRELSGLQAVSPELSHQKLAKVTHTLERQGKSYFVVKAADKLRMLSTQPARLLVLRNLPVAVMVDGIDRMQEIHSIHALPEAFSGEERRWYRGLTLIKGKVVPVVRADAFLSKAEVTLLSAALSSTTPASRRVAVTA